MFKDIKGVMRSRQYMDKQYIPPPQKKTKKRTKRVDKILHRKIKCEQYDHH